MSFKGSFYTGCLGMVPEYSSSWTQEIVQPFACACNPLGRGGGGGGVGGGGGGGGGGGVTPDFKRRH